MPLDPNIALGFKQPDFGSPVNDLAQILQLQGVKQENQLNQMKMDEYGRGVQRANALQSLLSGDYATPDARQTALIKGGFLKEATDYAKGNADVAKTAAEIKFKELEAANKRADLAGSVFGFVRQNPTPENAFAALDHLASNGIYTPEQVAEYKAKVQANPQAIGQMADLAFRAALSTKEQLAKMSTVNAGDRVINQAVDPVSGKVVETASTVIKESEAERLRREQSARDAAAGRAQSERHFQVTQANTKVPSGYRLAKDGVSLEAIPGGPADAKAGVEGIKKVTDAKDVLSILDEVDKVLPTATGGYIGTGVDAVLGAANVSTGGAKAGAKLKVLQGALISKMPKMSGPQSDKDVLLYREMAGQIADTTLPIETRQAASKEVRRLNEKYAGMAEGASNPDKPTGVPKVGEVQDGHRFKGGNPADPKSWEKI